MLEGERTSTSSMGLSIEQRVEGVVEELGLAAIDQHIGVGVERVALHVQAGDARDERQSADGAQQQAEGSGQGRDSGGAVGFAGALGLAREGLQVFWVGSVRPAEVERQPVRHNLDAAAAEGVGARKSATKSAMVKSVS